VIKCLVFDFDGVLVDSNAVKRSAYCDVFASLNVDRAVVEQEMLGGFRTGDRYQVIERILRHLMDRGLVPTIAPLAELVERCADQYNRICESFAATCREVPGASIVLPRLAREYALYVNSGTPEEPLRRIVQARGWTEQFRDVLGAPQTKIENLRRVLDREKVEGFQVLCVGDRREDLDAALDCGCGFVGVRSDENDFDRESVLLMKDLSALEEVMAQSGAEGRRTC